MQPTTPPSIDELLTHATFVRAVAHAAVHGDADVDDVVQATWLAAIEKGPRHGGSPRGWLATVARNAARGLRRGEGRRQDRETRAARPEGVPSTAEIAAKEEARRRLLEAVLGLEEPYRSAVLLRYYEDLPPREVARRLGVPVETARTRVKRGLAQLRARLDDRWGGDRRAWAVAVAPLAGAGFGGVAMAAGAGLLAKAAAAVLAVGLLGGGAWYAIDRTRTAPAGPDPVELAAGDEADDGPVLRPAPDATVRSGGTIRGTVLLDAGEGEVRVRAAYVGPLDDLDRRTLDLAVLLSPPLGRDAVARTTMRSDGTYRLDGLAKGLYLVTARASDGRAHVAVAALLAERGEAEISLDLRRGPHTLTGRVTHADGSPCTGWTYLQRIPPGPASMVTLTWPQGRPARRLGPGGTFRFEHLRAGKLALVVVEPGDLLLRRDRIVVPTDEPLDLVLGGPRKRRARVIDAGTGSAIGNARTFLYAMLDGDTSFLLTTAWSDGEGRLTVDDPGGRLYAAVVADGYAIAQAGWPKDVQDLTIELQRVARIRGRVVDAEGRALAGVGVRGYTLDGTGPGLERALDATTDEKGRFHLDAVAPGDVMVYVHGAGWTVAGLAEVKARGFNPYARTLKPGEAAVMELVAVPAASIEGRVVGPDGRGLAGVPVGVLGEPWPDLPGAGLRPRGLQWTTDDLGAFRIDTVLPGEHLQVVATTPDGARVESKTFALAGGAVYTVSLVASAARTLDVRVADEDGTPVAGAYVLLAHRGPDGRETRRSAVPRPVTDASGRVRVGPLAASDLAVGVRADGYLQPKPVALTAAHRAGDEPLQIVLRKELTIRGRVRGPAGLGLTTVAVDLLSNGTVDRSTEASEAGAFRFDGLPAGAYALRASAAHEGHGWKAEVEVEDPSRPVRLELTRGAALKAARTPGNDDRITRWTLHVRGPDGEDVPQSAHREYLRFPGMPWQVSGYGRGRGPATVQTHVSGTDEVYVELFAPQDGSGRPLPYGAALVQPGDLPAGGGEHPVTLPPEQHVCGRVVGPDGEGLAGVPIEAFADYGTHQLPIADHDPHARTRSGRDGSFDLRQFGPFAYVLRLDLPQNYAPHPDVPAHAGDDDLVIALRPSVSARVSVVDEAGRAIPGVHVQLTGARGTAVGGTTDAEGVFAARGLAPEARYRVTARFPENDARYLPLTLEDQAPGPIEIVLRAAQAVEGTVVDPRGRPLPWARVYRQTSENGWETHFADESGRFVLERLPAGELVLMVSPALALRWFEGTRHTVRAPASDLRLTAELGGGLTFRLPADVKPEETAIRCTDQDDPTRRGDFHPQMIRQRTGTIHGLDPAHRYALYVVADGCVFHATDLRPGPGVVEIAFAPWRTLTVRLDLPGGLPEGLGWEHASVSAEVLGWRQHGRLVDPQGPAWEIPALPAGPCTVRARLERWARTSNDPAAPPERVGRRYEAVAEGVAADEVRLTLREAAD